MLCALYISGTHLQMCGFYIVDVVVDVVVVVVFDVVVDVVVVVVVVVVWKYGLQSEVTNAHKVTIMLTSYTITFDGIFLVLSLFPCLPLFLFLPPPPPPLSLSLSLSLSLLHRYYFAVLQFLGTEIRLSFRTTMTSRLTPDLKEIRRAIPIPLAKFEDALIPLGKCSTVESDAKECTLSSDRPTVVQPA